MSFAAAALLLFGTVQGGSLLGQSATAPAGTSIHGKVTNAAGLPVTEGQVKLTQDHGKSDDFKYKYSFPVQPDGTYKGTGIADGTYTIVLFTGGVSADYQLDVVLKPFEDKVVDFDMSRQEYIDKMTPEAKKQLEDYKKRAAATIAANATIQNLNALLVKARADNKAGNYADALKAMSDATKSKPEEPVLWVTLGDAQLGTADALARAARAASTDPRSQDILDQYSAAAASYQKALDLNAASKKPNAELAAAAYNQLGQSYGKAGKTKESADAYEQAAKTSPAGAAMYFYNEAATLFNAGDMDGAAVAADKSIALDSTRAEAYYIKGQSLVTKASVDPKTNKIVAPPGCIEAYQKYLELEPQGKHAKDVEDILTGFGQAIKSSYKAGKKP
jgi:tetratricopeptide (TPR) repeat protein